MELDYWNFVAIDELSDRAIFANKICKLIYQKHKGDINLALEEYKDLDGYLHEYVRNIYELIQDEIPLMAYHDLIEDGASNYDLSDEEYEEAKRRCIEAAKIYYNE